MDVLDTWWNDPVFWEHVDNRVIKQLKNPLGAGGLQSDGGGSIMMVKVTKAQGTPRNGYRYDFLDGFISLNNNRVCIGYKGDNGRYYGLSVTIDDMLAVLDEENKEK